MEIYIEDAKIGGKTVIERLLSFDGVVRRGLRPAIGLNLVAGVSGAGKTSLGLALWWFLARALQKYREAFGCKDVWDTAIDVARRVDIPYVSGYVKVCLKETEIPQQYNYKRYCIEWDGESLKESSDSTALAKTLLSSIVVWPRQLREVVPLETGGGRCGALVHLMPPVMTEEGPTLEGLELENWLEAEYSEVKTVGGTATTILAFAGSTGEISEKLLKAANELSEIIRQETKVTPFVYIDDGFDGVHTSHLIELVRSIAPKTSGAIYVTSHRLEVSDVVTHYYVVNYGLSLSRVVNVPSNFRVALIELKKVPEEYEAELEEASKALTGLNYEELKKTLDELMRKGLRRTESKL